MNSNLELAKKQIIKLFKDEETYHRFVLTYFNKHITEAFSTNRKNGLYISCEMDLRGFDGEYLDFARFHNYNRFNYPVIKSAQDNLYRLELGLFCCGGKDSTETQRLRGYYDMFNDDNSSSISTPEIIQIDGLHNNFKYLKDENVSRLKNTPFIMMDESSLSAFTYFRIMAYNKTKEYMENGISDALKQYGYNYKSSYSNAYISYALALRDTCKFFETFYSPDKVKFIPTQLPYRGLSVIEQKVKNIKEMYNIPEVGTMRLFKERAMKLPALREDTFSIAYIMAKYGVLKGKFTSKDELKAIRDSLQNTLKYPEEMTFDSMGRNTASSYLQSRKDPIKDRELADYNLKDEEIEHALKMTTASIQSTSFKNVAEFQKVIEETKELTDYLNTTKESLYKNSMYLGNILQQTQKYKANGNIQYPMFFEINVPYGTNIYIQNSLSFIESKNFPVIVENINKIFNIVNDIDKENHITRASYKNFNSSMKDVESCEEDVKNYDRNLGEEEAELYRYLDVETGTHVIGNEAKYSLNNAKVEHIKNFTTLQTGYDKLKKDFNDLDILLRDTKELMEDSIKNEDFKAEDFLGFDHFIQNIIDIKSSGLDKE